MDFSNFLDFDEAGFWLEPDTVLANVITAMVNMMGMPIGITLFVKGVVISGTLVSEQEYLTKLTEVFRSAAKQSIVPTSDEESKVIEEVFDFTKLSETRLFADIAEDDDESDEDFEEEGDELPPYIRYLHVKDFSVLTPNPPLTFAGSNFPILRIRLASVDGWMLGQATPVDFGEEFSNNSDPDEILH